MRIPHELGDEFPDQVSLIGRLTKTNYEFNGSQPSARR